MTAQRLSPPVGALASTPTRRAGHSPPGAERAVRVPRWLIVAALVVAVAAMHTVWLPLVYHSLSVGEAPRSADALVLLGGGRANRAHLAADLFLQGFAPVVITTEEELEPGETDCWATSRDRQRLERLGVPATAIVVNCRAGGTWEEAGRVLAILEQIGARDALVLTDAYHTRRARATFRQQVAGRPIDLIVVGTPPSFVPGQWWRSEVGLVAVQNEYLKLIFYVLHYRVWPF